MKSAPRVVVMFLVSVLLLGGSALLWAPDFLPPGGDGGGGGGGGGGTSSVERCGDSIKVWNRTPREHVVVYRWGGDYHRYTVKAKTFAKVQPVYCPSTLIITTGGENPSVTKVDPARSYELLWSSEEKRYIVRAVSQEPES